MAAKERWHLQQHRDKFQLDSLVSLRSLNVVEEHELGVAVSLGVEVEDVPLQLVLRLAPQPRRTPQRRRLL